MTLTSFLHGLNKARLSKLYRLNLFKLSKILDKNGIL